MDKKKQTSSLKTGIAAGFLGSLCCTGPVLIVALGLGSIGFALGFSKYRPFFVILAIIFLSLALYRHIKKKHGVCNAKAIKDEAYVIFIAIITAVVIWALLIYVIVPFIARYVYG